jgi:hypothetical protein
MTLETGAVSEVVEITAQGSLVDTTTAAIGRVFENRRVQELPLNGRNALSLVLLAPAVPVLTGCITMTLQPFDSMFSNLESCACSSLLAESNTTSAPIASALAMKSALSCW